MSKFSIIIPVYNVALYLRRCLDSVLAQTFTDWEALCVDDGSTDDSGAILDEYAAMDTRIKVFHQANKGVNFARQSALDNALGEWIASVDSDDWVDVDFLKNFADALADDDCDMLWTDFIREESAEKVIVSQKFENDACALQRAMISDKIWGGNVNKCYRRMFVLDKALTFPIDQRVHVCEDLCFNIQFLSYKPRLKYAPLADYHYMIRNGSSVHSKMTLGKLRSSEYINSLIFSYTLFKDIDELRYLRNVDLKSYAYCAADISNKEFAAFYPEIKSLKGISTWPRKRILFWLSTHGFRTQVMWVFKLARWLRSI